MVLGNLMDIYKGEIRQWCECHGWTKAYAFKIHGFISIVKQQHYPWIRLAFGKNAKIIRAEPDQWKMAGDRLK
jgi:hypothetical protein